MQRKTENRFSNWLLISSGLLYSAVIIVVYLFWKVEELADVSLVQDFVRTLANAGITATIGVGSMLLAISSISKQKTNNIKKGNY